MNRVRRGEKIFLSPDNFEDIPETKKLAPDTDKIMYHVCKAYNVEESVLYISRRGCFNEPRNVCIYLVRYLRSDTLKETGALFGIKKHSTVSSIIDRIKLNMKSSQKFKKRIMELSDKIKKGHIY